MVGAKSVFPLAGISVLEKGLVSVHSWFSKRSTFYSRLGFNDGKTVSCHSWAQLDFGVEVESKPCVTCVYCMDSVGKGPLRPGVCPREALSTLLWGYIWAEHPGLKGETWGRPHWHPEDRQAPLLKSWCPFLQHCLVELNWSLCGTLFHVTRKKGGIGNVTIAMIGGIVSVSVFMWHSPACVEDEFLGLCSLTAWMRANKILVGFFFFLS